MDWYIATGVDELVVPKEREESDMLLSPDSWMQWGTSAPEGFWLPDKYFVTETKPVGELNFKGKTKSMSDEVDNDRYTCERDHSSSSSVSEGLSEALVHRNTLPRDWPDRQLDDLEGIDEMDDIFLSSLLEDLPIPEDSRGSFCFPPRPHCSNTRSDDLFTDTMLDSQSITSNSHAMGSSKYLKTHDFSPSMDWENKEVTSSHYVPFDLGQKDSSSSKMRFSSPVENITVPSEENSDYGHEGDEPSMEESILQELETVMEQMTDETRLCFRDSLYRLAKNSKQYTETQSQHSDVNSEKVHQSVAQDETLRSEKTEASESETNTIDRAIANLMFNKMQLNAQELPAVVSVKTEQGVLTTGPCDYSSNQLQAPSSPQPTILPGDAEVPIFCR